MKPGWKTSEFWLTVLTSVGTLFTDVLPASVRWVPTAVSSAAYAISRGLAKLKGG
jgi:hypothetical protein